MTIYLAKIQNGDKTVGLNNSADGRRRARRLRPISSFIPAYSYRISL